MENFEATVYTNSDIELKSSEDLDRLYSTIENEENFILQWVEKNILHSEVIITTHIASKVKTGELKLTAKQKTEE